MADNVYLLETRLSAAQLSALHTVRDAARESGLTVFLVGGAVRDLISGSPVRDLDFAVQGNALKLRKPLEEAGARFSGEVPARQALFLRFPSGVRVEVGSTISVIYPKPGKPVFTPVAILDDLRRRDFTANAMALSLNEGSYGLLMDPLNGVADIENRELRLVNNYGFIEDPVRMIRAARLMARQGWMLDERTRTRYETGKEEGYIKAMQPIERDYELEELFHEEDPLRVMRRLEEEGWLRELAPGLSVAQANTNELGKLRDAQMQLQTQGILADAAAANFLLLTAKSNEADRAELMRRFPRAGFVEEIQSMEAAAKEFASRLTSKEMTAPSKAFVYIRQAHPATVLWTLYSSRSGAVQGRLKSFLNEWQQAPSKIPYTLMAEMRITPELPEYPAMLERLTFALMDGQLGTAEEMKAFLEPYSPPAPPPPPSLRRPKAKKEAKSKSRKKAAPTVEEPVEASGSPAEEAAPAASVAAPAVPVASEPETPAAVTQPAAEVAAPAKSVPEQPKSAKAARTESKTAPERKAPTPVAAKKAGAAAVKPVGKTALAAAKPAGKAKVESKPANKGVAASKGKSEAKGASTKPAASKAAVKGIAKVAASGRVTGKPLDKKPAKGGATSTKAAPTVKSKAAQPTAKSAVAAKRPAAGNGGARKTAAPVSKKAVAPVKAAKSAKTSAPAAKKTVPAKKAAGRRR